MNTLWLLLARYEGEAVVSAEKIAADLFEVGREGYRGWLRKVETGEIPLPLVRMERSQKGAKKIDLRDLAAFLDERRAAAQKELRQLRA
ncbi:MAG: pyocin activator PrtN family protein [Amaricoccus sp.]